ncbi:MAG: hypothetical protein ACOC83_08755, partial [Gemmatimonadota bacterium]
EGGSFRFGPGEGFPWAAPAAPIRIRSRVVPDLPQIPEMPQIEAPLAPTPGGLRGPLFVI